MSESPHRMEDLYDKLEQIADGSGRFDAKAFLFVLRGLEHARHRLKREGHVSGQELAESIRQLAIAEFGPTAKIVLNGWGVETTEDIGRIVFAMIEGGLLSKTPEDSIDDFRDRFDFETEFVKNYPW